jgi:hypothetical protein
MDTLLNIALDRLEAKEYASLIWGFVEGGFSQEQILNELKDLVRDVGEGNPDDLLEDLIDLGLLFELKTLHGQDIYRTRFAEGVRLFANLRQIFPNRSWRISPSLVSDFRVDHRPRCYPARDLNPEDVIADIENQSKLPRVSKNIWHHLTSNQEASILLSGFQARATKALLSVKGPKGVIVTAGTGSGKTLSFYLPVLMKLGDFARISEHWTKCIAVYPRVELLKDQFSETLNMCSKIASELNKVGRRPLTVGTLFGETPFSSKFVNWEKISNDQHRICPYASCPKHGCDGSLLWQREDIVTGRERLVCQVCGHVIDEETIVLTRTRAFQTPPDILFTTTEMLHKRIADTGYFRLLGIGLPSNRRPKYVLLDEVHTYAGMSGAQSALVMRRWRQASKADATFMGLSATLLGADRFFHQLTGIPLHKVQEVRPTKDEMVEESSEYQLVLQGDPVSQTSLLSTSIQTVMLLGRLMDPLQTSTSKGRFGKRVFVFTDNLDVTNRLYDDLRDAEGINPFGRRQPPLANLRSGHRPEESPGEAARRDIEGQSWHALEVIGHTLSHPLIVGRTSSKDPGVATGMNVIVATASLEVGFNDPGVGAVVQHKAPRGMAQFVQRKGRAGRYRLMRPWVVTILSDYGRDRLTYQYYDQLFDPILQAQHLPIKNLYILRMQAVAAFFDWLAQNAPSNVRGWFWKDLSTPNYAQNNSALTSYVQSKVKQLLQMNENLISSLSGYLKEALSLSDDEVMAILLEPPRSLFLEALPTLQRRLASNWVCLYTGRSDLIHPYLPLPEFVPPNLFTELTLPDVLIDVPNKDRPESFSVARTLKEILPGKITRRFAENQPNLSHWVPIDVVAAIEEKRSTGSNIIEVDYPLRRFNVTPPAPLGEFTIYGDNGPQSYPIYRPWRVRLEIKRDNLISDTSNAFLDWQTEILPWDSPIELKPAERSRWRGIINSVMMYLHTHESSVTIRRFGHQATASLRRAREKVDVRVRFIDDEERHAGIGFEYDTDGLRLTYQIPLPEDLVSRKLSSNLLASLRRAHFRETVLADDVLRQRANYFELDWLQQIFLAALNTSAAVKEINLAKAHAKLKKHDDINAYQQAMRIFLGIRDQGPIDEELGSEAENTEIEREHRLFVTLSDLLSSPEVSERLHDIAQNLYSPNPEVFGVWLRERIHETMVQAVFLSCLQNIPRHATIETLLADPGKLDPEHEEAEIWITEDSMGGSGVVEALARVIMEDPSRLFQGIEAAVAASDRELVAITLERILALATQDEEVSNKLTAIRGAYLHEHRANERAELYKLLEKKGVKLGKAAGVAFNARLLRPGTGAETDFLLTDLFKHWDDLERQLGVSIGLREFCTLAALTPDLSDRIMKIAPILGTENLEVAPILMGVLWPRRTEVQTMNLESYNPYRSDKVYMDPRLVREILLRDVTESISLDEEEWLKSLHKALARNGTCRLKTNPDNHTELTKAIAETLATPIDVGYLQFYPSVERFEEEASQISVVITLWEEL